MMWEGEAAEMRTYQASREPVNLTAAKTYAEELSTEVWYMIFFHVNCKSESPRARELYHRSLLSLKS